MFCGVGRQLPFSIREAITACDTSLWQNQNDDTEMGLKTDLAQFLHLTDKKVGASPRWSRGKNLAVRAHQMRVSTPVLLLVHHKELVSSSVNKGNKQSHTGEVKWSNTSEALSTVLVHSSYSEWVCLLQSSYSLPPCPEQNTNWNPALTCLTS